MLKQPFQHLTPDTTLVYSGSFNVFITTLILINEVGEQSPTTNVCSQMLYYDRTQCQMLSYRPCYDIAQGIEQTVPITLNPMHTGGRTKCNIQTTKVIPFSRTNPVADMLVAANLELQDSTWYKCCRVHKSVFRWWHVFVFRSSDPLLGF